MWAPCGRESAREARLDPLLGALGVQWRSWVAFVGVWGGCVTLLLGVAGATHAPWNKCAATGVTRVGRVVFVRGELTYYSRVCMLVVKCRWRSCGGV